MRSRPIAPALLVVLLALPCFSCRPDRPGACIVCPPQTMHTLAGHTLLFKARLAPVGSGIETCVWDFGDGGSGGGETVSHAFDTRGSYQVCVTMRDSYACVSSDTVTVIVHGNRFVKLDAAGDRLADEAGEWAMVHDRVSNLIWECKRNRDGAKDYDDPGDADNTYTWYDSDPLTNGGDAGTAGDGTDTEDFIAALNSRAFGNRTDWRMPTYAELGGLRDASRFMPAINTRYFPATAPWYYWTGSTYEDLPGGTSCAYHVYFMGLPPARLNRGNHYGMKYIAYHARAVCAAHP